MNIGIVQIDPFKGQIEQNINLHLKWLKKAVEHKVDLVLFSELSLSGYEPDLVDSVAVTPDDERLTVFQNHCDEFNVSAAIGAPVRSEEGILISLLIYRPNLPVSVYSKTILYEDEFPFFVEGKKQTVTQIGELCFAPAICYESMKINHAQTASELGADIYLSSVAKSEDGVNGSFEHYPKIARQFSMPVVMSNCIGRHDNFIGWGKSAAWNAEGQLVAGLSKDSEEMLIIDDLFKNPVIIKS